MRNRIQHLRRDERGMSFVFVGLGLTAFLAATTIAIDVGMFMNAATQAQNSADAGALAGVTALYFNDWNNRSAGGPAVESARSAAKHNKVIFVEPDVDPRM
jgi:Flp pilus assembly protein TadG